eukprot:Anaeramoba_ignava/a462_222.p1 GENE.a462_222~~a462_222.p1  ORF type:complete len:1193 (-),score=426.68 a462_222:53-3631(-)
MKTFTFSIIVFLLFLLISFSSHQQLEVFIVPHTHDDPAWLETFMGYYTTRVQYILTNTITDLLQNPTHKFIYVENSFFRYWWDQQNSTMQENVINLIKLKQFEFVNGGYVMNDEAVTNYDMIINQMTIGHQWIKENIGEFAIPKIAFHIDPFGSSNMSPFLFSQMCFDAFVIDRIPWDTKIDYMAYKHMEFIWRGSRNWGSKNEMFTYVCPPILYETPIPFNWEQLPELNPDITDENLVESADLLVSVWKDRNAGFLHNQSLFLFGGDFEFHNPEKEFGNMDKLLNYINSHQEKYNVTAHYSILSEYFESINKEQINYPILGAQDFFPYYFLPIPTRSGWWSGYFTSWPLLKGLIRSSNANLFTIEFANTIYNSKYRTTTPLIQNILPLRNAVALTAHHDAITGTSPPDVNQEQYIDNLISGSNIGDKAFIISLQHGLTKPGNQEPTLSLNQTEMEKVLSKNQTVPIIVFNSLGWTFDEQIISFNLSLTNMDFEIIGTDLKPVESIYDKEIGKLTFIGKVPAIGFSTYFIQPKQSQTNKIIKNIIYPNEFNSQTYTISNKFYSITFSGETGLVILVKNKVTGGLFIIDNNIFRYSTDLSGAYIFTPYEVAEPYSSKVESITQITSELYDEIHQVFASNLTQIWRLYRTNNEDLGRFIEIEHKLGPNLEGNKEVVTRFITSIPSEGVFYQTNNDLEIMKRVYNSSECITENYYPFTGACWIEDSNQRLTIITDRAHGITSIESGVIEVMIARRTLQDDFQGLNMPLEDTTYYKSKLWIMFDTIEESERSRHISSLLFNTPFKLTYGISPNIGINEWMNSYLSETTTLCNDLPRNIHLLSLIENEYSTKQGILRLQHLYENDTDSEYSKVVEISLNELFSCNLNGFSPSNYQEQTLSLLMTPNQCSTNQMKWNQNKELNEESKSNSLIMDFSDSQEETTISEANSQNNLVESLHLFSNENQKNSNSNSNSINNLKQEENKENDENLNINSIANKMEEKEKEFQQKEENLIKEKAKLEQEIEEYNQEFISKQSTMSNLSEQIQILLKEKEAQKQILKHTEQEKEILKNELEKIKNETSKNSSKRKKKSKSKKKRSNSHKLNSQDSSKKPKEEDHILFILKTGFYSTPDKLVILSSKSARKLRSLEETLPKFVIGKVTSVQNIKISNERNFLNLPVGSFVYEVDCEFPYSILPRNQ